MDTFGWGRCYIKNPGGSLSLEMRNFATIRAIQRSQGQGLRDWVG